MKTILKNAKIYDGTGNSNTATSILIEDDKIMAVGTDIDESGAEVMDLNGLSLAPGFIDAHSHNDWFATVENNEKYFEPFVRQGITSFVTGNCGISVSGYRKDTENLEKMGGGLFNYESCKGNQNFVEFFDNVNKKSPLNIASCIGHCTTRTGIAGFENRNLTEDEEKEMHATFEKALQDGACGISLGLMYEPGLYAPTDELKKIVKICEKYNKPLTVHPRACSSVSLVYANPFGRSHILRAADELVEITKGTKAKLQYSHAIFVGKKSFPAHKPLIKIFEKLKEDGVDSMFDIYSEEGGVTVITVIMPPWYQAMSAEDKKKKINVLKFKVMATISKNLLGFDFADMFIAYMGDEYKHFEGKNISQIAKELNMKDLDAYLYLCEISNYKARVIVYNYSNPEIISKLSKHEQCLYQTDAWVEEKGVQNPAIYDCFPKFLQNSLKGTGDTMPNTIRKMSGAVADRYRLENRGYIKEGMFADLTIFDEAELKTSECDKTKSFGIKKVFVNGKIVLDGDTLHSNNFSSAGMAMKVL